MATFEFITTMLWVMVQPIIGWAIIDMINIPTYIKICRNFKKQREEEMMEIIMTSIVGRPS